MHLSAGWLRALNTPACRQIVGRALRLRHRNVTVDARFRGSLRRALRAGVDVCVCQPFPATGECHWFSLGLRGDEVHLYNSSDLYNCEDAERSIDAVCRSLRMTLVRRDECRSLQRSQPYCQTWSIVFLVHHRGGTPLGRTLFWRTCARIRRVRSFRAWESGEPADD